MQARLIAERGDVAASSTDTYGAVDAADHILSRGRAFLSRPAAARGDPASFPDEAATLVWFHAETATLKALLHLATERRLDDIAWQLAESQAEMLRREHRVDDLLAVSEMGRRPPAAPATGAPKRC